MKHPSILGLNSFADSKCYYWRCLLANRAGVVVMWIGRSRNTQSTLRRSKTSCNLSTFLLVDLPSTYLPCLSNIDILRRISKKWINNLFTFATQNYSWNVRGTLNGNFVGASGTTASVDGVAEVHGTAGEGAPFDHSSWIWAGMAHYGLGWMKGESTIKLYSFIN